MTNNARWNGEYDLVALGAGAAGMTAAVTATIEGRKVLLIEKTDHIGGATGVSGGVPR